MIWLKVTYNENEFSKWPENPNYIAVALDYNTTVPEDLEPKATRLSPIYPLVKNFDKLSLDQTNFYFFNFENAYRILGKIENSGAEELKKCVFFSTGLSSVILITSDSTKLDQFRNLVSAKEKAFEHWIVEGGRLLDRSHDIGVQDLLEPLEIKVADYSVLPLTARALIDEFVISVRMLMLKVRIHMPSEIEKINSLIKDINILIIELVYFETFDGSPPESINEFTREDLLDKGQSNKIRNQNLDRIISVNSALSYVSTQAFSGAIPILERRSLIRRNSLLGIGSAILALNNVVRFVEECFAKVPIKSIILTEMEKAGALTGMDNLPSYDPVNWHRQSVSILAKGIPVDEVNWKLPYFSGRLGFRETEYSIGAAIQSITSGASLEWSLMTLTHEMLHGHVREIINTIFFGPDHLQAQDQRRYFYQRLEIYLDKKGKPEHALDSIRLLLLSYCCLTASHGSITSKPVDSVPEYKIILPSENGIWNLLEVENRNINEIFVHILDLHYFYASRTSVYIPLIWCSWVAVPHISGDLRQYILRSLLTIATKETGTKHERFKKSVEVLKDLLSTHKECKLNSPVIDQVISILNDEDKKKKYYYPTFLAAIIVADVAFHIFMSKQVRSALFNNDELITWEDAEDEEAIEKVFKYNLPDGFNDEMIKAPLSYMLDRMIKELNSSSSIADLERETTLQFLALNSNS